MIDYYMTLLIGKKSLFLAKNGQFRLNQPLWSHSAKTFGFCMLNMFRKHIQTFWPKMYTTLMPAPYREVTEINLTADMKRN